MCNIYKLSLRVMEDQKYDSYVKANSYTNRQEGEGE